MKKSYINGIFQYKNISILWFLMNFGIFTIFAQEMPLVSIVHDGNRLISAIDISPDGKHIVSASFTSIKVWSTDNLELWNSFDGFLKINGHRLQPVYELSEGVNGVRFLNNDEIIIGGNPFSSNIVIKAINFKNGNTIDLTRHQGNVPFIAISKDRNLVLTSSNDGTIREYNIKKNTQTGVIGTDGLSAIDYNQNGNSIAIGSQNGTLTIKSKRTNQRITIEDLKGESNYTIINKLEGINSGINSVKFNNSGTVLAVGYKNGNIILFDTATYERINSLNIENQVGSLKFTNDGRRMIANDSKNIYIWNTDNFQLYRTILTNIMAMRVALTSDDKYIVTGSRGGIVRIWSISKDFNADLPIGLIRNDQFRQNLTVRQLFLSNNFSNFINDRRERVYASMENSNIDDNGIMHLRIVVNVNNRNVSTIELKIQTNSWMNRNYITFFKYSDIQGNDTEIQCDGTEIYYIRIAEEFSKIMDILFEPERFTPRRMNLPNIRN